jgi:DNA-binding transcriptional MerR regulator
MTYTTEQIAQASRATLRGVRLWEGEGLFGLVPRDDRGNRLFSEEHMSRAKIITTAQMAGMSLAEIKAMLGNFNATERQKFSDRVVEAVGFMRRAATFPIAPEREAFDL